MKRKAANIIVDKNGGTRLINLIAGKWVPVVKIVAYRKISTHPVIITHLQGEYTFEGTFFNHLN